jgi:serine/threonine-protein kinase HipA
MSPTKGSPTQPEPRRRAAGPTLFTIEEFDGLPAILIERYDRHDGRRLHQEDFSQALGASRNQKYQEVGGIVSFQRIAETLKTHAPEQELRRLARMVVLAVGIGNLDLHTKNLGLLHPADGDVTLAPAYDVVPQTHLATDGGMALAVNGKFRHQEISRDDLFAEFAAWGLRRAATTVTEPLDELQAILREEEPLEGAFPPLQEQLQLFVDNLSSVGPVGGETPSVGPSGFVRLGSTSPVSLLHRRREARADPRVGEKRVAVDSH